VTYSGCFARRVEIRECALSILGYRALIAVRGLRLALPLITIAPVFMVLLLHCQPKKDDDYLELDQSSTTLKVGERRTVTGDSNKLWGGIRRNECPGIARIEPNLQRQYEVLEFDVVGLGPGSCKVTFQTSNNGKAELDVTVLPADTSDAATMAGPTRRTAAPRRFAPCPSAKSEATKAATSTRPTRRSTPFRRRKLARATVPER
jgi:hypothetical protein